MLSLLARVLLIVLLTVTLAGCAAIAGIFKAGFWVCIVIAILLSPSACVDRRPRRRGNHLLGLPRR